MILSTSKNITHISPIAMPAIIIIPQARRYAIFFSLNHTAPPTIVTKQEQRFRSVIMVTSLSGMLFATKSARSPTTKSTAITIIHLFFHSWSKRSLVLLNIRKIKCIQVIRNINQNCSCPLSISPFDIITLSITPLMALNRQLKSARVTYLAVISLFGLAVCYFRFTKNRPSITMPVPMTLNTVGVSRKKKTPIRVENTTLDSSSTP